MKIVTILGARPQFIKASAISRVIRTENATIKTINRHIKEIIIHTGQHFDSNMSEVFFKELEIPEPDINLGISGLSHGAMTGRMLEAIEMVLDNEKPDLVLVYGDTNSTLAGSLAASKLHIPIAHVEAGLRSFNRIMPEEINRIITDHISKHLFCPTQTAVDHLAEEGINVGVHLVGDVMFDCTQFYSEKALQKVKLGKWGITEGKYVLCTIHREENTNILHRLESILSALQLISKSTPVLLPIHPRTRQLINSKNISHLLDGLIIIDPVPYLEMTRLQMTAKAILTDSGGMQKEAFFHKVPCITLRDETEWVETVQMGWNKIAGADKNLILEAYESCAAGAPCQINPYGDGQAAKKILEILKANFI